MIHDTKGQWGYVLTCQHLWTGCFLDTSATLNDESEVTFTYLNKKKNFSFLE